ncbi:MAG: hypothetical protein ABRQ38_07010 [Candidatus Eremiobacterota bacterium]
MDIESRSGSYFCLAGANRFPLKSESTCRKKYYRKKVTLEVPACQNLTVRAAIFIK